MDNPFLLLAFGELSSAVVAAVKIKNLYYLLYCPTTTTYHWCLVDNFMHRSSFILSRNNEKKKNN